MKYAIFFISSLLVLLSSCDKYESGIEDPAQFKNVYMPRAANDSIVVAVTRDAASFKLGYSAYLGGPEVAGGDVNVTFKVDPAEAADFNTKYGTNYPLLPETHYTLSGLSGVIPAGGRSTDSLVLTLNSGPDLALFKTYILPVSIQLDAAAGVKLLPRYATTYYLIKVGQEEILNLGSDWGGILSLGPKQTIVSNQGSTKDILMYLPNAVGVYDEPPLRIGIFWDASESFYYVDENAMVVRNLPFYAGLFRFDMHPENIMQSNPNPADNIIKSIPDWNTFWLGDFWDKYQIIPFGPYFFTVDNSGNLWRQPRFSKIDVNRVQVATDFNFNHVVAFPSDDPHALIGVTAGGQLWYYPVDQTGQTGDGKLVGNGWNIFKKVIARGNELLVLSSSNGIYSIAFDAEQSYFFE